MVDHSPLSRRHFLTLASSLVASGILAACGSTAAPTSPSSSSIPPSTSAVPKPSTAAANSGVTSAAKPSIAAASAAASPGSGPVPTLTVAYVTIATSSAPLWVADAIGAYAKRGVKADLQYIQGDLALKAMVAKEIDVVMQSATALITADLNGQADLIYVGSVSTHAQAALYADPSVKSAADLKGKLIATDKPGSTFDYYTQMALKLLGLQPSDVQERAIGSDAGVLLQTVLQKQAQAAILTPPFTFSAEAAGLTLLQSTYSQPYQGNGPIIPRSRLQELTPALLPFLEALRDGIVAFNTQKDVAEQVITKYTKVDDPKVLEPTYQFYLTSSPFQADLKPTLEGLQGLLTFLSTDIPAAKTAKPEQFVDLSLLTKLPPLPAGSANPAA